MSLSAGGVRSPPASSPPAPMSSAAPQSPSGVSPAPARTDRRLSVSITPPTKPIFSAQDIPNVGKSNDTS